MTSLPATGLAYLLSQVGHHSSATFARHLEAIGLTPQQVGILRLVIVADGHYTQQALCQRLDVLPSRLVVLLDQLEDQRLVERRPNSEDRRSNVLFITAEGRRRFADAAVVWQAR